MNFKIAGFFGAVGFVLSLLAGIFGGVSFGIILLRSLAAGIVFGGLGVVITLAVKRFLPELTDSADDESFSSDGGVIDIVLEAEAPVSNAENPKLSGDDETDEGFIEEVEEVRNEDSVDPLSRAGVDDDDDVAELEDVSDGIDSLPDIGELTGKFSDSETTGTDRGASFGINTGGSITGGANAGGYTEIGSGGGGIESLGSGKSGKNVLGSDVDPQLVAKAIKTIMKKDE